MRVYGFPHFSKSGCAGGNGSYYDGRGPSLVFDECIRALRESHGALWIWKRLIRLVRSVFRTEAIAHRSSYLPLNARCAHSSLLEALYSDLVKGGA